MHKEIYRAFRDLIPEATGSVLEVGAIPSDKSLLCLPQLAKAERIGLNIDGPYEYGGFKIVKGNANSMPFDDGYFDLVVCNAVIEHDPYFWKTLAEIRRVTKPGGLIIMGAPGYRQFPIERYQRKLRRWLPWIANGKRLNGLFTATMTYQIHNEPGDFYRFSDQAFREVIMEGLEDVKVSPFMWPPRLIGMGRKEY